MDHSTFVEKYRSRELSISVDRSKASYMYQDPHLLPQGLRTRQALFRTVAFVGLLLGIASFFFLTWWLASAVLLFGFFMFPLAQAFAARGILEASLQDEYVYENAIQNEIFLIRGPV